MRMMIHDYAGHPFQVQLSRQLARRGHHVTHLYFADNPGPKGNFERHPSDPSSLSFIGITLGGSSANAAGTGAISVARRFRDVAYGRKVARLVRWFKPDVMISGNTPTEAQQTIINACKLQHTRFVYWVQDVYSMAVTKLLSKRLGFAGKAIGAYYRHLDKRQFSASDAIVVISQDFYSLAGAWGGSDKKVSVIENWAALDDLPVGEKANDWSRQHGLHQGCTFLYSGTLGRKHNPDLLLQLARRCCDDESVVVVAQGYGVPILEAAKERDQLDALKLLPIQPAQDLSNVLATADVLMATIEPDAGTFAVPSKVLSYLCSNRPILLAAPKENLAARIVTQAHAGIVVDPADEGSFLAAADRLRRYPLLREKFGAHGRAYAERVFNIERITDQFEHVLTGR